jgi:hypothetical protein
MAATVSAKVDSRDRPTFGDVLVAKLNARVEHQIAFLPGPPGRVCPSEATAIAEGARLARERQVDAWLTQDHRHYLKCACHRPDCRAVTGDHRLSAWREDEPAGTHGRGE